VTTLLNFFKKVKNVLWKIIKKIFDVLKEDKEALVNSLSKIFKSLSEIFKSLSTFLTSSEFFTMIMLAIISSIFLTLMYFFCYDFIKEHLQGIVFFSLLFGWYYWIYIFVTSLDNENKENKDD